MLYMQFVFIFLFLLFNCGSNLKVQENKLPTSKQYPSVIPSEVEFYTQILEKYKNKKVILITNPSGIGNNIEKLKQEFKKNKVTIKYLIGLEHGFLGLEENFNLLPLTIDPTMKLPIYHIYNLTKKDLKQILKNISVIIFDVQDMGMRAYTYLTVLKRIMDTMDKKTKLTVLDHPNLSLYLGARGEPMKKKNIHFAGEFPSLFFTGLTIGESAIFYNQSFLKGKINLQVIKIKNFRRAMQWEETRLFWNSPSPNLPTLQSARNYMSLVFLEGVNISVGRGTQAPFIYFGSPWFSHSQKLNRKLNEISQDKLYFNNIFFKPAFSDYKNQICKGLKMIVTDYSYDPIETAYKLIFNLKQFQKENFKWKKRKNKYWIDLLWGNSNFRKSINQKKSYINFHETFIHQEKKMNEKIKKYFIY